MWKLTNMMGKMTRLYLSISLPLMPRILVGGSVGGRVGRGSCTGWGWPFLTWWWSRGRVSCPPVMAQVIMQQEWSWSWVWKTLVLFFWLGRLILCNFLDQRKHQTILMQRTFRAVSQLLHPERSLGCLILSVSPLGVSYFFEGFCISRCPEHFCACLIRGSTF